MQLFERPFVFDQPGREVVQQFWVAGRRAPNAEIANRFDEWLAKMPMPDTIHENACRQRVPRRRDAPSNVESRMTPC